MNHVLEQGTTPPQPLAPHCLTFLEGSYLKLPSKTQRWVMSTQGQSVTSDWAAVTE